MYFGECENREFVYSQRVNAKKKKISQFVVNSLEHGTVYELA